MLQRVQEDVQRMAHSGGTVRDQSEMHRSHTRAQHTPQQRGCAPRNTMGTHAHALTPTSTNAHIKPPKRARMRSSTHMRTPEAWHDRGTIGVKQADEQPTLFDLLYEREVIVVWRHGQHQSVLNVELQPDVAALEPKARGAITPSQPPPKESTLSIP